MYIHKQGRVRYRTLCGSDVPDRAIDTDSQRVSCPNCISLEEMATKNFFGELIGRLGTADPKLYKQLTSPAYEDIPVSPIVREAKLQNKVLLNNYWQHSIVYKGPQKT